MPGDFAPSLTAAPCPLSPCQSVRSRLFAEHQILTVGQSKGLLIGTLDRRLQGGGVNQGE